MADFVTCPSASVFARFRGSASASTTSTSTMSVSAARLRRCTRARVSPRARVAPSPRAFLAEEPRGGAQADERALEYVSVSTTAPPREKAFSVTPTFSDGSLDDGSLDSGGLSPMPKNVENRADDPSLKNPLQRHNRLSTSWMGVIVELEGVCVEYERKDVVVEAWKRAAEEVGKGVPMQFQLDRAIGMKADQAVEEAFNWTRNPAEARRIAGIKQGILDDLLADVAPVELSSLQFLKSLKSVSRMGAVSSEGTEGGASGSGSATTPCALVSSSPESVVYKVLDGLPGLESMYEVVVSAEDVFRGRPDPEGYLYAAQRLERPPFRCVVIGNSNASVEAAHDVGMKCVVVAGSRPLYELGAADLVVRSLEDVSFMNLKKLFQEEQSDAIPLSDLEEEDF